MKIALILDPSALCEYARLSLPVGELLAVVVEDGAVAGVPALALLEAMQCGLAVDEAHRLQRLMDTSPDRPVSSLNLNTRDAESIAAISTTWRCSLGMAHALHETRAHDGQAHLLTGDPDLARRVLGKRFSVLSVSPDWDEPDWDEEV